MTASTDRVECAQVSSLAVVVVVVVQISSWLSLVQAREQQGMDDRPWFLGAHVPGKKPSTLAFLGGMAAYNGEVAKDVDGGFGGYELRSAAVTA